MTEASTATAATAEPPKRVWSVAMQNTVYHGWVREYYLKILEGGPATQAEAESAAAKINESATAIFVEVVELRATVSRLKGELAKLEGELELSKWPSSRAAAAVEGTGEPLPVAITKALIDLSYVRYEDRERARIAIEQVIDAAPVPAATAETPTGWNAIEIHDGFWTLVHSPDFATREQAEAAAAKLADYDRLMGDDNATAAILALAAALQKTKGEPQTEKG